MTFEKVKAKTKKVTGAVKDYIDENAESIVLWCVGGACAYIGFKIGDLKGYFTGSLDGCAGMGRVIDEYVKQFANVEPEAAKKFTDFIEAKGLNILVEVADKRGLPV